MQIAISTRSLATTTSAALERAAALGLTHIELNLQQDEFGYGYRRRPNVRFYRELRKQLDALNLRVWSITLPPLTEAQMFSPRARKDIMMNAAGAGGIVGATTFVVEPSQIYRDEDSYAAYLSETLAPAVVTGYDETWAQVVNRRMTMALRNVNYWVGTQLTNHVENLTRATDHLAIGVALDIPAAIQRSALDKWLTQIGERVAVAYMYDVDDAGTPQWATDDAWSQHLAALAEQRVHAVVLHGSADADDSDIQATIALARATTAEAA